ncbi:MAG: peptidylprolyl isomerase [Opitutaceae bacterium]|nr:peptidylprolyl isomerase [Opitutaceae bacterium]
MVLTINGFSISDEAVQREVERIAPEVQKQFPWFDQTALKLQAEDMAKDRFIEHRLLFEAAQNQIQDLANEAIDAEYDKIAKKHGGENKFLKTFNIAPENVPHVKQEIADDLRFQSFLDQLRQQVAEPTEEELKARYEKEEAQFKHPDQYKAAHIVFHTNEGQDPEEAKRKINDAKRRLDAGESFDAIADEDSDCPGKGGDLGWFPEGHMVEEFEKIVFKLEIGKLSDVFETPFGFHIARLDEKKVGITEPFEKVAQSIKEVIANEKRDSLFKEQLDSLKAEATIVKG